MVLLCILEPILFTNTIKDAFIRLDILRSELKGQCYDMAANIADQKIQVLPSERFQDIEFKAQYSRCYGHALNLTCIMTQLNRVN